MLQRVATQADHQLLAKLAEAPFPHLSANAFASYLSADFTGLASGTYLDDGIERAVVVPNLFARERVWDPLPVDDELILIAPRC